MPSKILAAMAKLEAKKHKSKGRIEEALDVYNTLLEQSPYMTLNTKMSIEARMELLSSEHDGIAPQDENRNLEETLQKFQDSTASEASAAELRKKAKAFYKERLYVDALETIKLMIRQNGADAFCINAVMGCMLHLQTKKGLAGAVDLFVAETYSDQKEGALFKMSLADKMAQKGYTKHAAILQKH